MKAMIRIFQGLFAIFAVTAVLPSPASAQNANFHNAPASAKALQNPYEGQQPPNARALFHLRCARCHGENGEGSGNIPPLKAERIKAVTAGEIFWFITKGDVTQRHAVVGNITEATTLADRQLRAITRSTARVRGSSAPTGSPAGGRETECTASHAAVY